MAIASREKMDGYQVKGKAEILTKGPLYEEAVKISEERARRLGREMTKPKAAIKIKVDEVYSLKPGPTAGEKIC